ncbi:MAG: hypothetical protein BWY49_00173 [Candidatus Omnitrophica bacterium ADurb.Bin314]|nr:MAG: hypothetical protein BWY49_00173 [Candidatus Omnitrophica bacterium ADurb.Bin314]
MPDNAPFIRDQPLIAFEEILVGEKIRGVEVEGQGRPDEGRIPDIDKTARSDIDAVDILKNEIEIRQIQRPENVRRTSPAHEQREARTFTQTRDVVRATRRDIELGNVPHRVPRHVPVRNVILGVDIDRPAVHRHHFREDRRENHRKGEKKGGEQRDKSFQRNDSQTSITGELRAMAHEPCPEIIIPILSTTGPLLHIRYPSTKVCPIPDINTIDF